MGVIKDYETDNGFEFNYGTVGEDTMPLKTPDGKIISNSITGIRISKNTNFTSLFGSEV